MVLATIGKTSQYFKFSIATWITPTSNSRSFNSVNDLVVEGNASECGHVHFIL